MIRFRAIRFALALLLVATLSLVAVPRRASALSSDYQALTTAGLYGLGVGTLAGLVSAPLSGSARNIFIGSSVGLYLGLAVGIYHITHRDDPGNPLRGELVPLSLPPAQNTASAQGVPGALVQVNFEVKRF